MEFTEAEWAALEVWQELDWSNWISHGDGPLSTMTFFQPAPARAETVELNGVRLTRGFVPCSSNLRATQMSAGLHVPHVPDLNGGGGLLIDGGRVLLNGRSSPLPLRSFL